MNRPLTVDGTRNAKHQQDTHHRLNVTCTGRVLGLLSHNPQFVSMGVVRPGQVIPRTVRIDVHDQNVNLDNLTRMHTPQGPPGP